MKHEPDFMDREIGRRLRLARITANVRLRRAAKLAGVTCQQICKYEVGGTRVSAVIIARLAQLYQRPVGWFLEEVPLGDELKAEPTAGLIERERIVTKVHELRDTRLPTLDPKNPDKLSPEEQRCIDRLKQSFLASPQLWRQMQFVRGRGCMLLTR